MGYLSPPHKGFLPGDSEPKLFFYQSLTLLYLSVGVLWAVACLYWRSVIFSIHHMMSAALFVGLLLGATSELVFGEVSIFSTKSIKV